MGVLELLLLSVGLAMDAFAQYVKEYQWKKWTGKKP